MGLGIEEIHADRKDILRTSLNSRRFKDEELVRKLEDRRDFEQFKKDYEEIERRKSTNELLNNKKRLSMFLRNESDFNFVQDIIGFLKKYKLGSKVQLNGSTFYDYLCYSSFGSFSKFDKEEKYIDLIIPFENSFTPLGEKCIENLASDRHPKRWNIEEKGQVLMVNGLIANNPIFYIIPANKKNDIHSTIEIKKITEANPINLTFTTKKRYWE